MAGSGNNNNIGGNIFSREFGFTSANPFGSNNVVQKQFTVSKPAKRLNGYDSTILNNANFDNSEEQELSVDFRIKEKETALKDLDAKIKLADNYGTQNEALGLKAKKQRMLEELNSLEKQRMYGGRVLGQNQTFNNQFKEKMPVLYKIQNFISRNVLAKVSKKVNSVIALSDSLEQLSDISKSVDELIDMNIPYGERGQNYEKLTQYLNKANSIHTKISKSFRK
jgi:hypothetical protein